MFTVGLVHVLNNPRTSSTLYLLPYRPRSSWNTFLGTAQEGH